MQKGYILGISCGYHDSAASLIKDGTVLGACEEERFTGIKHDSTFPINTIKWLMETYNVKPDTLDVICFYENPKNKLDRIKVSTEKKPKKWYEIFNKKNNILIRNQEAYETLQTQLKNLCGKNTKIHYTDHHQSHLAYSYYTSNFNESAILSVDGVGDFNNYIRYLSDWDVVNVNIKKLQKSPHIQTYMAATINALNAGKVHQLCEEFHYINFSPVVNNVYRIESIPPEVRDCYLDTLYENGKHDEVKKVIIYYVIIYYVISNSSYPTHLARISYVVICNIPCSVI